MNYCTNSKLFFIQNFYLSCSADFCINAGYVKKQPETDKSGKCAKKGPKYSVNSEESHSLFNRYANKIVKNNMLVKPSESRVYEKIASKFEKYKSQSAYQAAKRYFEKRIPSLKRKKTEEEDRMYTYDRFKLKSQKYTKFTVNIKEVNLFQNCNGESKSLTEWSPLFRRIVFAMSQVPCAWSISRPRNAGNEITVNAHCLERACEAKLFAFTEFNQAELTINITPPNRSVRHEKKNQLRGSEREKILDMLKTNKAKVVVANIANEGLRIGDVEPPFPPNVSTV